MLEAYRTLAEEPAAESIPAKPLSPEQVSGLIELLKSP
ncbi:MAG: aconitate hydratase 2/2-methylisocitrate dehydratase, partial [Gammaproteobacteria bacterium]